jgi:hypothetical protein
VGDIDQPFLILSVLNTALDFLILFLPANLVYSMSASPGQRTQLALLFGAGLLVCTAGCVRVYYINENFHGPDTNVGTDQEIEIWTSLELNLALICACLPGLRAFIKSLTERAGQWWTLRTKSFSKTLKEVKPTDSHELPIKSNLCLKKLQRCTDFAHKVLVRPGHRPTDVMKQPPILSCILPELEDSDEWFRHHMEELERIDDLGMDQPRC